MEDDIVLYKTVVNKRLELGRAVKVGVFEINMLSEEIETIEYYEEIISLCLKEKIFEWLKGIIKYFSSLKDDEIIPFSFFELREHDLSGNEIIFTAYLYKINKLNNSDNVSNEKLLEYDLVEVRHLRTHQVFYIPAYFFPNDFIVNLPYSERIRDDNFFVCPICGDKSFYEGVCSSCLTGMNAFVYRKVKAVYAYERQVEKFEKRFIKMVFGGQQIPARFKVEYVRCFE
jgi:hypothetical protein